MENEKTDVKDRLLAGVAYYNGFFAAIISWFYFKDRKGVVYWHCVQAVCFSVALTLALLAIKYALYVFNPQIYGVFAKSISLGPSAGFSWLFLAIFAVLFIAAVSGRKFRIPFICRITDWVLNYIDKTLAKAEKAKKKKV